MKISVSQENLAQGLSIVSRAVAARSTLPVLANVLMATDEGRLRLSATDRELGITCWFGARIEEDGSTTVPARIFSDLVGTLPKDHVEIDLNDRTQTLKVRCGPSDTEIKCIDAEEFPPMDAPDLTGGVTLNVADLKEMILQVVFSASADEARPVLTGVLVAVEDNQITLATADGFRLSERKAALSSPVEKPFRVVVPARALRELARILPDGDQPVTMGMLSRRGQVVFRAKDVELSSQLINEEFPDYGPVIPKRFSTRTIVSTQALLKACRQAEIFARDGSNIARVNVLPGGEQPGTVEISAQSEETGSNVTVVDANVEGPAILIAFNVRFMRDVLEVIKTPNVALETSVPSSPGVFRPLGDEGFLHVIMPMHM